MTPESFNRYLKDPSLLDSNTVEELWMLVKDYPYFQVARMLLARNLYNTGHEAYALSLRLAAAYAGDRGKLKDLVEGIRVIAHEPLVEEQVTEQPFPKEDTEVSDTVQATEPLAVESELKPDAEELPSGPGIVDYQQAMGSDASQNNEISAEIHDDFEAGSQTSIADEVNIIPEDANRLKEPEKSGIIQNALIDTIFSRLRAVQLPEEILTDSVSVNPETETISAPNRNQNIHNDLVEKFIREEPRISAPKREFYNAEDIAKQSSTLPEDLVTETLAWIYEQQGYYNLAIKIYEKLMLLIPEKSSYFAGRINEITVKRK